GSNLAGLLSVMILSGCAAGMGLFWGQAAFGPLTELMAGRSHSAISDEGLLKGGRLFPWATFCQFSLNDERTAIKLWSAHFKGAVAFTLMPPPDRIPAVESILLRHLPPAGLSSPGALEHFRFSTFMVALLIGSAAISFLILDSLAVTPAIALLFGLIYLLALLGSRIILLGIYGGLARPATIA
ncbi:MAG: hypothetical protein JXR32_06800, partial [Anaerolineaceae bacterium]|nr:hypothetical protein [Anaerolineaceae bacterium]